MHFQEFFRKFYSPSNASIVIAGDFEKSKTIDLVEKYFASIPPGNTIDRVKKLDTSFSGRIELFHEDKVQLPKINLSWPTVPEFDPNEPALDILGYILSEGRQSRLQKALVYDMQIARNLGSYQYCREIAGQFEIEVTANDQNVLPRIEDYIFEQLELIKSTPPSEQEITTAKNKFENMLLRRLEKLGGFGGVADLLNHFNVFAQDPNQINSQLERYQSVTPEDIQQVAKSFLNNNHVRMLVMPENSLKDVSTNLDRSKEPEIPSFPEFTPPTPTYSNLENGLQLLVLEKDDSFTVGTTILVHSGSKKDPKELPGLADLTNAMILEGTSQKTAEEISTEMDHLGDSISRDITKEYSSISTTMAKSVWDDAVQILAEIIQDPSFPTKELERIVNPFTLFKKIYYDDSQNDYSKHDVAQYKDHYVKVIVVNKKDLYGFDKFTDRLLQADCHEVKIIEDFSDLDANTISDDIIENTEDTMTLLSKYIDELDVDLEKDRLKNIMRTLYNEAQDLEL